MQDVPLERGVRDRGQYLGFKIGAKAQQFALGLGIVIAKGKLTGEGVSSIHPLTPTPAKPVFMLRRKRKYTPTAGAA